MFPPQGASMAPVNSASRVEAERDDDVSPYQQARGSLWQAMGPDEMPGASTCQQMH